MEGGGFASVGSGRRQRALARRNTERRECGAEDETMEGEGEESGERGHGKGEGGMLDGEAIDDGGGGRGEDDAVKAELEHGESIVVEFQREWGAQKPRRTSSSTSSSLASLCVGVGAFVAAVSSVFCFSSSSSSFGGDDDHWHATELCALPELPRGSLHAVPPRSAFLWASSTSGPSIAFQATPLGLSAFAMPAAAPLPCGAS